VRHATAFDMCGPPFSFFFGLFTERHGRRYPPTACRTLMLVETKSGDLCSLLRSSGAKDLRFAQGARSLPATAPVLGAHAEQHIAGRPRHGAPRRQRAH